MNKIFNFQFSIFNKLKFLWRKPKVVIMTSNNQEMTKKIISQILGNSFKVKKEVLFVDNLERAALLIKKNQISK